ncbi:hypothetical protein ASQ44_07465 (plasmid) [Rickettsia rhipicephali]|uniref:hypothetical protein n=1 Tax=Rickettsia rhipicephali TaxID=33992 RepID=UPI00070C188B|nr:hypothetical protein [Rickettsia rhipicephali]ALN41909.1 hypothetical protein ASQ44_07465 [Rickettsia rhipicephali]
MIIKKHKLQSPIINNRIDSFINNNSDNNHQKGLNKTQPINITLTKTDLLILEEQIDRATQLGLRTKNRSSIIRMALRALARSSDDLYIILHKE